LFVWGINVLAAAEAAVSKETVDQAAPAAEMMLRRSIDLADRRFQQISLAGMVAVLILAYLF
jgi:hypothetical protein